MPPPIRAAFIIIQGICPANPEAGSAPRDANTPKSVQTSRYAATKIQVDTEGRLELGLSRWTRAKTRFIWAVAGNIIAIIITTQIARNDVAPIPIVKPMSILFIMLDCQIRTAHDAAPRISSSARMKVRSRCKLIVLPAFSNGAHHAPYMAHSANEQERARDRMVTRPARAAVLSIPKLL